MEEGNSMTQQRVPSGRWTNPLTLRCFLSSILYLGLRNILFANQLEICCGFYLVSQAQKTTCGVPFKRTTAPYFTANDIPKTFKKQLRKMERLETTSAMTEPLFAICRQIHSVREWCLFCLQNSKRGICTWPKLGHHTLDSPGPLTDKPICLQSPLVLCGQNAKLTGTLDSSLLPNSFTFC